MDCPVLPSLPRMAGRHTVAEVVRGSIKIGDWISGLPAILTLPVRILDEGTGLATGVCWQLDITTTEPTDDVNSTEEQHDEDATDGCITFTLSVANDLIRVSLHGEPSDRYAVPEDVPDVILAMVTRHFLDLGEGRTHLHGAALAGTNDRVVLILGSSGDGKSTLAAHLLHLGLTAMTDEQIGIMPDCRSITTFTRPIAIKAGGAQYLPHDVLGCLRGPVDRTRFLPTRKPHSRAKVHGTARLLIFLDRQDGIAECDIQTMTSGEACVALCMNNLDLVRDPRGSFSVLAELANCLPAFRIRYSNSSHAARTVKGLLEVAEVDHSEVPITELRASDHGVGPINDLLIASFSEGAVVLDPVSKGILLVDDVAEATLRSLPWSSITLDDEDTWSACTVVLELVERGMLRVDSFVGRRFVTVDHPHDCEIVPAGALGPTSAQLVAPILDNLREGSLTPWGVLGRLHDSSTDLTADRLGIVLDVLEQMEGAGLIEQVHVHRS